VVDRNGIVETAGVGISDLEGGVPTSTLKSRWLTS
jgi:hypothetical protein